MMTTNTPLGPFFSSQHGLLPISPKTKLSEKDTSIKAPIPYLARLCGSLLASAAIVTGGLFSPAHAAEPAPAAPSKPAGELAKPDLSKPIWVILQCDKTAPPTLTAEQKKAAAAVLRGPFFNISFGVGFALEQGRVTRPWFSGVSFEGGGPGPDGRTWSHAPMAWIEHGRDVIELFESVTATLEGDRLTATMKGTYQQASMGIEATPFDITVTGTVSGAKIEGQWRGTLGGLPAQGTSVGAILPAASAALDPANAVYQILADKQNLGLVVEVRDGKAVAGLARRLRAERTKQGVLDETAATKVHAVDAAGLTVTVAAPSATGRGATLNGTIRSGELGELVLQDLAVTPTGYGGNLISTGQSGNGGVFRAKGDLGVRAYPIDDPVASRWQRWMQAIYAGTAPVDPVIAQQARREAETLLCLPPPGQATQFLHRYPPGMFSSWTGLSCIYAPWFDFTPVEGAKRYRFAVVSVEDAKQKRIPAGSPGFEADTPTAHLSPIWKDLPLGVLVVTLTALDENGTPMGEAQTRRFQKRSPFGGEVARSIVEDDLAREVALRFPRALAQRYYGNLFSLWAVQPPRQRSEVNATRVAHDPFSVLVRHGTTAERALAVPLADSFRRKAVERMALSFFGSTDAYYSFGMPQSELPACMNTHEATGQTRYLATARSYGDIFARLIQPNGSWTWQKGARWYDDTAWSPFFNAVGHYGRSLMDHNAALYVNFYGRLRQQTGDDRHRDAELKGLHWLMHNALRTGYWEHQQQQSDISDANLANTMAIECLDYLLEYAPASVANVTLAEDLARYIEDRFIGWGPVSAIGGGTMTNSGQLPMALNYLRLWRATGKALYRAKAEALFHSYLIMRDPVLGLPAATFDRYLSESNDPAHGVRYVELRRALGKGRVADPLPPANGVAVLRLQHGVARAEPVGLHLDMQNSRVTSTSPQRSLDPVFLFLDIQGGKVRHAIATTPSWDGPILDFPQPGRLHWQDGRALFHTVDASKLTVTSKGIQGELVVHLKPPRPDRAPVATSFRIEAELEGRSWSGRHDGGAVDGEWRPSAADTAKADRLWFEIDRAVVGGESWQNWALAQLDLPGAATGRNRAASWLGNGNAGWSAAVESADIKTTDATVHGTLRVKVDFFGFRDGQMKKAAEHAAAFDQGLSFLAYWRADKPPANSGRGYALNIQPRPLGDHLEYVTSSQPVMPGTYEYRLDGRRLGGMVAGTVTVTGPDQKEYTGQFLGGVESLGQPLSSEAKISYLLDCLRANLRTGLWPRAYREQFLRQLQAMGREGAVALPGLEEMVAAHAGLANEFAPVITALRGPP